MRRIALVFAISLAVGWVMGSERSHHGMSIGIAESTESCVSCHNGIHAKDASYSTALCGNSAPHPVMIPYITPGKEKDFRAKEQLASLGIRLENGMISCLSCHDLRRDSPDRLAVNNSGSSLCLTCHIK